MTPPITLALIFPSLIVLQLALESTFRLITGPATIVTLLGVLLHPLASVIVTVYVPADTPTMLAEVAELLHVKV